MSLAFSHPRDRCLAFKPGKFSVSCTNAIAAHLGSISREALHQLEPVRSSSAYPAFFSEGEEGYSAPSSASCSPPNNRAAGIQLHARIEAFYDSLLLLGEAFQAGPESQETDPAWRLFLRFHADRVVSRGLIPVRTEWRIWDQDTQLCGTVDALFEQRSVGGCGSCPPPSSFHLFDWKRSGRALNATLLDPKFLQYSLQLNLYRWMLEKNYGMRVDEMRVVTFVVGASPSASFYQDLRVPDLSRLVLSTVVRCRIEQVRKSLEEEERQQRPETGCFVPSAKQRAVLDAVMAGRSVVVKAVPGAGKTTLMLQVCARVEAAGGSVLVFSYNRNLADDTVRAARKQRLRTTHVNTFHGWMGSLMESPCENDDQFLRLAARFPPPTLGKKLVNVRLVCVDEVQDCRVHFARFLRTLLAELDAAAARASGWPVQRFVVGGPRQTIYGFDGADVRFLHLAPALFGCEPSAGAPSASSSSSSAPSSDWLVAEMDESFRLTAPIADFVNFMSAGCECPHSHQTIKGLRPGSRPVEIYVCDLALQGADVVRELLDGLQEEEEEAEDESSIMLLGSSTCMGKPIFKDIANPLRRDGTLSDLFAGISGEGSKRNFYNRSHAEQRAHKEGRPVLQSYFVVKGQEARVTINVSTSFLNPLCDFRGCGFLHGAGNASFVANTRSCGGRLVILHDQTVPMSVYHASNRDFCRLLKARLGESVRVFECNQKRRADNATPRKFIQGQKLMRLSHTPRDLVSWLPVRRVRHCMTLLRVEQRQPPTGEGRRAASQWSAPRRNGRTGGSNRSVLQLLSLAFCMMVQTALAGYPEDGRLPPLVQRAGLPHSLWLAVWERLKADIRSSSTLAGGTPRPAGRSCCSFLEPGTVCNAETLPSWVLLASRVLHRLQYTTEFARGPEDFAPWLVENAQFYFEAYADFHRNVCRSVVEAGRVQPFSTNPDSNMHVVFSKTEPVPLSNDADEQEPPPCARFEETAHVYDPGSNTAWQFVFKERTGPADFLHAAFLSQVFGVERLVLVNGLEGSVFNVSIDPPNTNFIRNLMVHNREHSREPRLCDEPSDDKFIQVCLE